MATGSKPRVLFVYFSYTQQTKKVVDAMAETLRSRGCDAELANIEFLDARYAERFKTFPMPHPLREVLGMIPAELFRKPGKIGIPDVITDGEYDLVCLGAPTWWLSTDVPIKAFLESDTAAKVLKDKPYTGIVACRRYWKHNMKTLRRRGTKLGGTWIDGIHFRYQGGQVRSLLSLVSYLGAGENRDKYHGIKIPPTNLYGNQLDEARAFAGRLADSLDASPNA
jgi:multimeric flavodoxin WrbA